MVTPWEENQILSDIMSGLGAAIEESEVDPNKLSSIKLNKLLYLAVDDFGLPITYSWYKYGASLSGGQNDVSVENVPLRPVDQVPSPDEPSIGQDWEYPTPREYKYFFERDIDLDNILREETKAYLRTFYDDYAPEEFRGLYVSSAILQKSLDELLDADIDEFDTKLNTLSNTIEDELREVDSEILLNEYIESEEEEAFTSYSYTLREAIEHASGNGISLTVEQVDAFRSILRFFYSHAWKYIALSISEQTAEGPSRRDMIRGAVTDLDNLEKNYTDELKALRDRAIKRELLPGSPSPSIDTDIEMPAEINEEDVESALSSISEQMESKDYSSINPEEFTK